MRAIVWHFGSPRRVGSHRHRVDAALRDAVYRVPDSPVLTALGIVLTFVGIRRETGLELKAETESGQLLVSILGTIAGGFLVLFLVLAGGYSPVLLPVYVLGTALEYCSGGDAGDHSETRDRYRIPADSRCRVSRRVDCRDTRGPVSRSDGRSARVTSTSRRFGKDVCVCPSDRVTRPSK